MSTVTNRYMVKARVKAQDGPSAGTHPPCRTQCFLRERSSQTQGKREQMDMCQG